MVDADSQHFLWTALRWAAAALYQIERVRDSWEQFQAVRKSWMNGGAIRVTPEMERPSAIFWSDMQFLMIAVEHLDFTLEKLGRGTPRLNRTLKDKAVELRQLLELSAYWMLKRDEPYHDLGADWNSRRNNQAHARRLIAQLESLGHSVTLHPAA